MIEHTGYAETRRSTMTLLGTLCPAKDDGQLIGSSRHRDVSDHKGRKGMCTLNYILYMSCGPPDPEACFVSTLHSHSTWTP